MLRGIQVITGFPVKTPALICISCTVFNITDCDIGPQSGEALKSVWRTVNTSWQIKGNNPFEYHVGNWQIVQEFR